MYLFFYKINLFDVDSMDIEEGIWFDVIWVVVEDEIFVSFMKFVLEEGMGLL